MLRVLHLTDPHLFADSAGTLRGRNTLDTLTAVLAHYREHDWRADVVLATGDMIQDDSAGAYERLRGLLQSLELPVICVPGNHDIKSLMIDAMSDDPFLYCGTVEQDDWIIMGIDSAVDGEVGGTISDIELKRVNATLAGSNASHALICMHHPLVQMGSAWLDSVGMTNGEAAIERLAETGKVRLALSGHVHQESDVEQNNIRCMTTPSTCRQFAQNSATFAVDDNPPAYRKLELLADGSQNTELVWVS